MVNVRVDPMIPGKKWGKAKKVLSREQMIKLCRDYFNRDPLERFASDELEIIADQQETTDVQKFVIETKNPTVREILLETIPDKTERIEGDDKISDIVCSWLEDHGFGGLYHEECGCCLKNIAPCMSEFGECCAGYAHQENQCELSDADYVVCARKGSCESCEYNQQPPPS